MDENAENTQIKESDEVTENKKPEEVDQINETDEAVGKNVDEIEKIEQTNETADQELPVDAKIDSEVDEDINIKDIITDLIKQKELLEKENEISQHKLSTFFSQPDEKENFFRVQLQINAEKKSIITECLDETLTKLFEDETEVLKEKLQLEEDFKEKEEIFIYLNNRYTSLREGAALRARFIETGRTFSKEQVQSFLKKDEEMCKLMMRYRKKSKIEELALKLSIKRQKAEAEDAFNVDDYEIVTNGIEKNNMIITPLKAECDEIQSKCLGIVNIMSHLAQKLQNKQTKKSLAEKKLKVLTDEVNEMRKKLHLEKREYDYTKNDNLELRQKYMMLFNPMLIKDYKCMQEENIVRQKELEELKKEYANIMKFTSQK